MDKTQFQKNFHLKRGETVYTILRHVSRSGMQRTIDLVVFRKGRPVHLDCAASELLGYRLDRDREGLIIGGSGMDMGFALVYRLSSALWPNGFKCTGDRCPGNDHVNMKAEAVPAIHKSGGYALNQQWL